jgi:glycerol-3-phosphate acyltransferase PlsX
MMADMLKDGFKKNIFTKIGYLFAKSGVKDLKEKMNYKKYGGAMLLGVNKVVVKAHGSSDAYSFFNALRVAYELANKKMVEKLKEEMK